MNQDTREYTRFCTTQFEFFRGVEAPSPNTNIFFLVGVSLFFPIIFFMIDGVYGMLILALILLVFYCFLYLLLKVEKHKNGKMIEIREEGLAFFNDKMEFEKILPWMLVESMHGYQVRGRGTVTQIDFYNGERIRFSENTVVIREIFEHVNMISFEDYMRISKEKKKREWVLAVVFIFVVMVISALLDMQ